MPAAPTRSATCRRTPATSGSAFTRSIPCSSAGSTSARTVALQCGEPVVAKLCRMPLPLSAMATRMRVAHSIGRAQSVSAIEMLYVRTALSRQPDKLEQTGRCEPRTAPRLPVRRKRKQP